MREWENIVRMSLLCSIFFLPCLCCCFLLYVVAFLCASLLSFAVVAATIKVCSCWVNGQKGWPFSGLMMKRRELSLFLGWGRVSLSGFSVAVFLEAWSGCGGRLLLSCVGKKCEKKMWDFSLCSLLGALEGRADYVLCHMVSIVAVAFGEEKSCVGGFRVELLVDGLSWLFWMNFSRIRIVWYGLFLPIYFII